MSIAARNGSAAKRQLGQSWPQPKHSFSLFLHTVYSITSSFFFFPKKTVRFGTASSRFAHRFKSTANPLVSLRAALRDDNAIKCELGHRVVRNGRVVDKSFETNLIDCDLTITWTLFRSYPVSAAISGRAPTVMYTCRSGLVGKRAGTVASSA